MGFFSGLCSFVGSVVSKVASGVGSVVRGAARVAGKALSAVASFGEKVVKKVKETWPKVRPFVMAAASICGKLAAVCPWPPVKAVLFGIEKGTKALLALENSPILKKVDSALKVVLPMAKSMGEKLQTWADVQEAKARQKVFDEARMNVTDVEGLRTLSLASWINQFVAVNSEIELRIKENKADNLDSYLQLRASSKILEKMGAKWKEMQSPDELTNDDVFLMSFAQSLLADEEIEESRANRFANLVEALFNRPLLAIVFEEMVKQWSGDLTLEEKEEEKLTQGIIKANVDLKRILRLIKAGAQDATDVAEKSRLEVYLKETEEQRDSMRTAIFHRRAYIEAAEGLLCTYEGDDVLRKILKSALGENYQDDSVEVIQDNVESVAEQIILCMQYGKQWEELSETEQVLIKDFANIFRAASKERCNDVVESVQVVEVSV